VAATAHLFRPAPVLAQADAAIDSEMTALSLQVPPDLPRGLYVLRVDVYRDGNRVMPSTVGGVGMDRLVLRPVQVAEGRPATGGEEVLALYGPEHAPPVIALVSAWIPSARGDEVEVALTWRSERQAPLNYWLSLRLRGHDGGQIASRDLPPLLGGCPTSLWKPGELLSDRVILPVPEGNKASDVAALEIILYDRRTLQAIGTTAIEVSIPS
jgi:hypothetical protein